MRWPSLVSAGIVAAATPIRGRNARQYMARTGYMAHCRHRGDGRVVAVGRLVNLAILLRGVDDRLSKVDNFDQGVAPLRPSLEGFRVQRVQRLVNDNVFRLDVTVDDALAMQVHDGAKNFAPKPQQHVVREPFLGRAAVRIVGTSIYLPRVEEPPSRMKRSAACGLASREGTSSCNFMSIARAKPGRHTWEGGGAEGLILTPVSEYR